MTSESAKQIITIQLLSNVSRSKDNRQLMKYKVRNTFTSKKAENKAGRPLFVF